MASHFTGDRSPPRISRPFYRNGEEHRGGADVSFADIVKIFGFKTAKVGRWVSHYEQQIAANLFFDALCDLADILQVPHNVVSLNGQLSIGFGVGGNKYCSAQYDARTQQLSLAKNAGGGALAHEWFHAFDHYICLRMFEQRSQHDFASQSWLDDSPQKQHPLNQLLFDWFAQLFLSSNGDAPSDYVARSASADRALKFYYYAQPQEMAARAFEAIIQDHCIKNAFLVQGTKQSVEAKLGIYPQNSHREALSHTLLSYFYQLGRALDKKSL